MNKKYNEFLESKSFRTIAVGKDIERENINPILFDFQRDVVKWGVKKGRCAFFLDTGLGKTYAQLEWMRLILDDGGYGLIIAPLSVARQTSGMAGDIGMSVPFVRNQKEVRGPGVYITNYEMIKNFDLESGFWDAVCLDESSILKSESGHYKTQLIKRCANIPYRLCATATPSPNDIVELGNHAEFLGIMTANEMKARFFINANKEHTHQVQTRGGETKHVRKKGTNKAGTEYRLKHHGERPFYTWLSTWAIVMEKPSDLGYDDGGFELPPLNITPHFENANYVPKGKLCYTGGGGIREQAKIRRFTIDTRIEKLLEIITPDDQWIVWVGLDDESAAVAKVIPDAVEVYGSKVVVNGKKQKGNTSELKARALEDFQDGKYRVLITKAKIAGMGMNFQNAHKMIMFGLNFSWEQFYQMIRRMWRFGQKFQVDVGIILSDIEDGVWKNIMRKEAGARRMRTEMIAQLVNFEKRELGLEAEIQKHTEYKEESITEDGFTAWMGDSAQRMIEMESNSVDLIVNSPAFIDLYTYSDMIQDLGNVRSREEFFHQYGYIIRESLRILKPGRVACIHTMAIPALKAKDGFIGLKDFPGDVIRAHIAEGWTYYGEAIVPKNPQAKAQITHAKGLLFAQLAKDSTWSRPTPYDRVLLFKKPGKNEVPVTPVENREVDNERWIYLAKGVWFDVRETHVLKHGYGNGRDKGGKDEKHICPLQLDTIKNCVLMYSNPGELVFSPFGGIGSEGYVALELGRRAHLIELKQEYYQVLLRNLRSVVAKSSQMSF